MIKKISAVKWIVFALAILAFALNLFYTFYYQYTKVNIVCNEAFADSYNDIQSGHKVNCIRIDCDLINDTDRAIDYIEYRIDIFNPYGILVGTIKKEYGRMTNSNRVICAPYSNTPQDVYISERDSLTYHILQNTELSKCQFKTKIVELIFCD